MQTPTITTTHMSRIAKVWSEYAGEPVTVDPGVLGTAIGSGITVYGSELGMLRLHYRMKCGRVAYSPNLGKWYYADK